MRHIWALALFQLAFVKALPAQEVDLQAVPSAQAQEALKALIPQNKKFAVINTYVAGTNVKDVNLGVHCSSSSSGSISGTVDDNGNIDARTHTGGSTSCRELHQYYNTLFLGLADLADSQSAYLITVQCVEKWVWNHCDMPPEKTTYPIVLEVGKHGSFNVYAATSQKLGGKQKVAKFAVLDVTHVRQKDQKQATPEPEK